MRKVLLATTAIVAISGISAANADISIGGNYEWEYTSKDTGATFGDDGIVRITATNTADNGMTFTAVSAFGGGSGNLHIPENYIQIDGDFGSLMLGSVDGNSASSLMDGALGRNKDIETQGGLGTEATHSGTADTAIFLDGGADLIYMSPKVGGLQIGMSIDLTDSDAVASDGAMDVAATYSMGGISLFGSTTSGQEYDQSNMGVSANIAGLNIGIGMMDESGGTSKGKSQDVGVNYTLANGIKVAALSASGTGRDGTTKIKASNFGASYSIAPGVALNAETGVFTKNDVDSNYTWVAVNMKF